MSRLLPMAAGAVDAHPAAALHLFETESGHHALVVNGSRVYSLSRDAADTLARAPDPRPLLGALRLDAPDYVTDEAPADPPVRALSLAIAQRCNLGCSYCYAQGGSFGGEDRAMPADVAFTAVERLVGGAPPGERVHLTFLGGEPLTNRPLIRACTERAAALARGREVEIGFAITTNGTLLTPEDGEFFERFGFAVTISVDGTGAVHDRLRPFKDGRGSYARIVERVRPLLAMQRRMQVSARVTVTPVNLGLRDTLDGLLALGFHSVGFSPMLAAPAGAGMDAQDLERMLTEMIACGREFEARTRRGERYAFQNLATALREIHRGTHRPYPCGAGAGYLGVSASGDLYACHRFVEDPAGALGNVHGGVDRQRQRQWLTDRHVHAQEPCRSCWARYLCGGGCHHEVIHRGRPACDYIRGWLHYCLQAYVRMLDARPDWFADFA
jgi:uncharacterized protein